MAAALRVLYITGDYYDINAVWQTNITSDVNVMYQLQNEPSADLMALHPDANLTQSVNTGNNQLTNDAAIVDVNPDVIYVDGHVYTDSILVQADLLPTDQDDAVNAGTDALVTELIAFVDDNQDQTCASAGRGPIPGAGRSDGECAALEARQGVSVISGSGVLQMSLGGNDRLGRVANSHPKEFRRCGVEYGQDHSASSMV